MDFDPKGAVKEESEFSFDPKGAVKTGEFVYSFDPKGAVKESSLKDFENAALNYANQQINFVSSPEFGKLWDKAEKEQKEKPSAKSKTTVKQDFIRGAKDMAKARVSEASLAGYGLVDLIERTPMGKASKLLREKVLGLDYDKEQIFANMESVNQAIEEGADSGEGKERGVSGKAIAMLPPVLDMLAAGKGSTGATMAVAGQKGFTGASKELANTTDSPTAALVGAVPQALGNVAAVALPAGKGLLKGALIGGATNPVQGMATDAATKGLLTAMGEDRAAANYDPLDVEQRLAEGLVGAGVGGVVGRYSQTEATKQAKKVKDAYDTIMSELEAINAATVKDVDASNIRSPYMKKKKYLEAQKWADQDKPGWGELDDVAHVAKMNKTFRKTGQFDPYWVDPELDAAIKTANDEMPNEAGMGRGEILEDVDEGARQNPYMSDKNFMEAFANAEQGKGPAFGEMDFQLPKKPVFPTDPDKALNATIRRNNTILDKKTGTLSEAVKKANDAADLIKSDIKVLEEGGYVEGAPRARGNLPPTEDFSANVRIVNDLYKVTNGTELVEFIRRWAKDPHYKALIEQLAPKLDKDLKVLINDRDNLSDNENAALKGALGVFRTGVSLDAKSRSLYVVLKGIEAIARGEKSGLNMETVIHEIAHAKTDQALRTDTKYRAEVDYLLDEARKAGLTEKFPDATSDVFEFNAYGWTNLDFRKALASHKLGETTIWGRMVNAASDFLGIDRSLLKAVDGLHAKLSKVELDDAKYNQQLVADALSNGGGTVKKMIDRPVEHSVGDSVFEHGKDVVEAFPPKYLGDISNVWGKNLPTVNQLKKIVNHPYFNFFYTHLGKIQRDANARFANYADALHPVYELKRGDQLTLFKHLVDMQNPETLEALRMAEATNTREQYLLENGMRPDLVPHAIRVLDVMKHAYLMDNNSTARVNREPFEMVPMYFPRAHTGKYNVVIRNPNTNDVDYSTGFDSGVDAQRFVNDLRGSYKAQIDAGDLEIKLSRNHFGAASDIFSAMALEHAVPESVRSIAAGIEKNIEIAKRKFELHRAEENVPGYVGERLLPEGLFASSKGKLENDKLLNLLQNRLRSSYDWEVRSRIISEIKEPFFDDVTVLYDKPNLAKLMGQLINRQLGHEISYEYVGKFDEAIQKAVDDASRKVDALYGKYYNYKGGDLALVSPKALAETAQAWTYITSVMKLALHPPVMAANASAIPLVAIDGARTAAKFKLSQITAIAAYMDTLAYVGLENQGAKKFMETAIREGMIEPHIADTYDLAETSGHKAKNQLDSIINAPRNAIEKGTNFTAILYYYNFFKRAFPNMDGEALKQRVYEAARSYTGEYTLQSTPLHISQLGSGGRLISNFAKWKWNQIGRFADDMKDAKNGNFSPIMLNVATQVLLGGVYGTVGIVEYEALRRWFDLKPFTSYFDSAKEVAVKQGFEPESIEWLRRGALNKFTEEAFYAMGFNTAPDISGTMRHSSALDAPIVSFVYAKDVFVDALPPILKSLWEAAGGKTTGTTVEDEEKVLSALPSVLSAQLRGVKARFPDASLLKMQLGEEKKETMSHNKFNEKGIYRRSEGESAMAQFGFRSTKENNYTEQTFVNSWERKNRAEQISLRVKGILNNQDNVELFKDNIEDLALVGGTQTVQNIVRQIMNNEINKNLSADEQAAVAMLNTLDPTRKKFMLDQMLRFVESRNSSSGR